MSNQENMRPQGDPLKASHDQERPPSIIQTSHAFCSERLLWSVSNWLRQDFDMKPRSPTATVDCSERESSYLDIDYATREPTPPGTVISISSSFPPKTDGTMPAKPEEGKNPNPSTNADLVKRVEYYPVNLESNNIFLNLYNKPSPERVERLRQMCLHVPDSFHSTISHTKFKRLRLGATEAQVELEFNQTYFLHQHRGIAKVPKIPFHSEVVPGWTKASPTRVAVPCPDLAFGYEVVGGFFTESHKIAGARMSPPLGQVHSHGLAFPFLIVEIKADGGGSDLCVATKQCLVGAATGVQMVMALNQLLQSDHGAKPLNEACFSIAANQFTANLYVSWKEGCEFITDEIASFAIGDDGHSRKLDHAIQSILNWGRSSRLDEIQQGLQHVAEADRKEASQAAKGRPVTPQPGADNLKRSRTLQPASPTRRVESWDTGNEGYGEDQSCTLESTATMSLFSTRRTPAAPTWRNRR